MRTQSSDSLKQVWVARPVASAHLVKRAGAVPTNSRQHITACKYILVSRRSEIALSTLQTHIGLHHREAVLTCSLHPRRAFFRKRLNTSLQRCGGIELKVTFMNACMLVARITAVRPVGDPRFTNSKLGSSRFHDHDVMLSRPDGRMQLAENYTARKVTYDLN